MANWFTNNGKDLTNASEASRSAEAPNAESRWNNIKANAEKFLRKQSEKAAEQQKNGQDRGSIFSRIGDTYNTFKAERKAKAARDQREESKVNANDGNAPLSKAKEERKKAKRKKILAKAGLLAVGLGLIGAALWYQESDLKRGVDNEHQKEHGKKLKEEADAVQTRAAYGENTVTLCSKEEADSFNAQTVNWEQAVKADTIQNYKPNPVKSSRLAH